MNGTQISLHTTKIHQHLHYCRRTFGFLDLDLPNHKASHHSDLDLQRGKPCIIFLQSQNMDKSCLTIFLLKSEDINQVFHKYLSFLIKYDILKLRWGEPCYFLTCDSLAKAYNIPKHRVNSCLDRPCTSSNAKQIRLFSLAIDSRQRCL